MVAQVNFRGEYVTPVTLENVDPYLFLIAYVAIFFVGYWAFRLAGRKATAMRTGLTGFTSAAGALMGALCVGIPGSLFSELVFPIEDGTLNIITFAGAACGWGWFARVAWSERSS